MRENKSKLKKLTFGLLGTVLLLMCILIIVLLFKPETPRPRVTFVGFAKNAAGISQAIYSIHNSGRGTLRRWDFYEYSLQHGNPPTEIHLGPDALLAPGESETVSVAIPSDTEAWRITFYFSDYAPGEVASYTTDIPFADGLASGSVDSQMATNWTTTPEQYHQQVGAE